jgi:hypothetical protein
MTNETGHMCPTTKQEKNMRRRERKEAIWPNDELPTIGFRGNKKITIRTGNDMYTEDREATVDEIKTALQMLIQEHNLDRFVDLMIELKWNTRKLKYEVGKKFHYDFGWSTQKIGITKVTTKNLSIAVFGI